MQAAGRSNASTPSVRLFELPWLALKPRPRLAKPRQISHWFAPPVSADVGGEDRVAAVDEARAAGLELHAVHHELDAPGCCRRSSSCRRCRRCSRAVDEVPVHLPQHRVPDVADAVRLADVHGVGHRRVGGRVDRHVGRVRRRAGCRRRRPAGSSRRCRRRAASCARVRRLRGQREREPVAPALAHLLGVAEAVDASPARRSAGSRCRARTRGRSRRRRGPSRDRARRRCRRRCVALNGTFGLEQVAVVRG